jgi:hypothetical protein
VDALTPRLLYVLIQAAGLLFALTRLNAMGLLPTRAADYASGLPPAAAVEWVGAGVGL